MVHGWGNLRALCTIVCVMVWKQQWWKYRTLNTISAVLVADLHSVTSYVCHSGISVQLRAQIGLINLLYPSNILVTILSMYSLLIMEMNDFVL